MFVPQGIQGLSTFKLEACTYNGHFKIFSVNVANWPTSANFGTLLTKIVSGKALHDRLFLSFNWEKVAIIDHII